MDKSTLGHMIAALLTIILVNAMLMDEHRNAVAGTEIEQLA